MLGEQGLKECRNELRCAEGHPKCHKATLGRVQGPVADPNVAIGSERVNPNRVDPGAVPNAGFTGVKAELGTMQCMPLETLVKLEHAVRWSQDVCVVQKGQGLLIRAEVACRSRRAGARRRGPA